MLSSVLKSRRAIEVNIAIMRTFVKMRKFIDSYEGLARQIAEMEKKYDRKIIGIFRILDRLADRKKTEEIGFKTG